MRTEVLRGVRKGGGSRGWGLARVGLASPHPQPRPPNWGPGAEVPTAEAFCRSELPAPTRGGGAGGGGSRTPPVTSGVGYERWLSRPNGSLRLRSSGGPRASSVSSARAQARFPRPALVRRFPGLCFSRVTSVPRIPAKDRPRKDRSPLQDLTPNPLSQEGEGAKKHDFKIFPLDPSPLSLLGSPRDTSHDSAVIHADSCARWVFGVGGGRAPAP